MGWLDIYDRMKVDIPEGEIGGMRISRFEVKALDDWLDSDESREDILSPLEYVRLERDGRAPKPGWYTRLSEGLTVWMSDVTAERRDHAEPVFMMSTGHPKRVVINGLGIGMVLSAALTFDSVEHVDVVEADQRVIDLVGPHYLKDPRVRIHHADAVEQMHKWAPGERWDIGWTNIWPTITPDNLPQMKQFSDFYGERCGWHGNWSEDICKRLVCDARHDVRTRKDYWDYLTEDDKDVFRSDDEDAEECWGDED